MRAARQLALTPLTVKGDDPAADDLSMAYVLPSLLVPAQAGPPRQHSLRDPSIHDVIDGDLVRAVFQPLVHLQSRRVVGYEALARGPEGSAWENPMAMLDAARDVGRLPELDWVCRAAAVTAAADAGLDASLTLFLNLEPETIGHPCPPRLEARLERGSGLRIVMEFTERALARDPAGLLTAVNCVRSRGWGVALDDVGAVPASLALLPFVDPDVIKLDLRLVQDRTDAEIASIAYAVRAHAERRGASVLAEGIETEAHVETARVLGATLGQGWLFGRPGPLPAGAVAGGGPTRDVPFLSAAASSADLSPFDIGRARRVPVTATKRAMLAMSHHVENLALSSGDAVVLLSCFQDARHFTPATRARYRALVEHTALTAVVGRDLPASPAPGVRGAALDPADPLCGEWNVIVVGPFVAAALLARDLGDDGPDPDRRFDFVITHDRDLVLAAADAVLRRITAAPDLD